MEILEKLFGSTARLRLMKLFMFNPDTTFDTKKMALKLKISPVLLRKELLVLQKSSLIKKRPSGWVLNHSFELLQPLSNLLSHNGPLAHKELIQRLSKVGRVKLIVVSGIFTDQWDGRIDIMLAGDKLNKKTLETTIRSIEADIGKDLRYAALDTVEFHYRAGIGDKLVRDVFDYPHEVVLDKIGIRR